MVTQQAAASEPSSQRHSHASQQGLREDSERGLPGKRSRCDTSLPPPLT